MAVQVMTFVTKVSVGHRMTKESEEAGMNSERQFDVIIIGTGAGGGTLADKLAPSGKRILILERGDYVPREKDNWNPHLFDSSLEVILRQYCKNRD